MTQLEDIDENIKKFHEKDKCIKCGDYKHLGEMYSGKPFEMCYQCYKEGKCKYIKKGGFVFEYDKEDKKNYSLSQELIKFKYGRKKKSQLLKYAKQVLNKIYPELKSAESIIPIPQRKSSDRDFNAPDKIAKELEEICEGNYEDVLYFNRKTSSQKELSFNGKFINIRGAISLKRSIDSNRVLIVDDVFTTGATMMEASKVLKEGGVEHIYIFCLGLTEPLQKVNVPKEGWPS